MVEHEKRFKETSDPKNDIILQAIMKAIVVTYGKCFSEAKARKIKLEQACISKDHHNVHLYMMTMRNQYVAHGGLSQHEHIDLILLLPPYKKIKKAIYGKSVTGTIKLQKHITQTTTTSLLHDGRFTEIVSELKIFVQNHIAKLNKKLNLDKIDPVLFWGEFPKKDRVVLNEERLATITRS